MIRSKSSNRSFLSLILSVMTARSYLGAAPKNDSVNHPANPCTYVAEDSLNRRTFVYDSALGITATALPVTRNALAIPLPAAPGHLAMPTGTILLQQE